MIVSCLTSNAFFSLGLLKIDNDAFNTALTFYIIHKDDDNKKPYNKLLSVTRFTAIFGIVVLPFN